MPEELTTIDKPVFAEDEVVLWGESQVPDAEVIVEDWLGENRKIPQKGTRLALTPDHMVELLRCKESIHYFAENYYTITVGGNKKEVMKLWDIQKEALNYFIDNNRVVMNSSRQTSKTTLVVLFVLWNLIFGDGLQAIGLLGNKFDLAKLNLNKVKEAYEALPLFIKPTVDRWNEKAILFDNKNECKITATSSTSFRGETLTSLIIDEAAFVNEGGKNDLDKEILQSLLPTLDAMAYSEYGDNSFCILVSTPYGMNNEFARLYHRAKEFAETGDPELETNFRHFEMLWSDHPLRDQAWFDKKVIEMGSVQAFYVEFGGSFTMGDDITRMITSEVKTKMVDEFVIDPIFTQNKDLTVDNDPDDTSFKIWEFPQKGRIYITGVDCAEGVGDCYSTAVVLDVTDLSDIRQVAEYRNNTISTSEFPLVLVKILNAYNQCYAAIEANNCGREIISALHKSHGYLKVVRYHYNAESNERMVKNDEYGIISHNNSKNMAASNLGHFLNKVGVITIRSKTLITELDGFVKEIGKNNNWTWGKQGGSDSYDDLADALSWAVFMLHQKIVEEYFYLSEERFNKYSKPIKLDSEVLTYAGDHREHQLGMPINNNEIAPCIYSQNAETGFYDPEMDDVSWLLEI